MGRREEKKEEEEEEEEVLEEQTKGMDHASILLKREAAKQMSVRHTAVVAVASIEKMLEATSSTTEMVQLQRQMIEFSICAQAAELAFLDVMVRMSDDLKLITLFELFDDDSSNDVSANELAACLQKLDKSKSFQESLHAAILSLTSFDDNDDGKLLPVYNHSSLRRFFF